MRVIRLALRAFVVASLGALSPPVVLGAPPGTLFVTDRRIDAPAEQFEKEVRAAAKTSLPRTGEGWKMYLVAYLRRPPGAEDLNIVFYDVAGSKKEPVNHYPIRTRPNAKIVTTEIEIRPEEGFKPGARYEVRVTRLVGGREEVFAKTVLQLAE
ncbi:MAG: hypothetical protein RMK29_01310 [Myxococcales bacterium]|nr:hypothetical protein [Myxococcota bacterium]MDW8280316.1 hypothetical protein [Myxococcales bacterium]